MSAMAWCSLFIVSFDERPPHASLLHGECPGLWETCPEGMSTSPAASAFRSALHFYACCEAGGPTWTPAVATQDVQDPGHSSQQLQAGSQQQLPTGPQQRRCPRTLVFTQQPGEPCHTLLCSALPRPSPSGTRGLPTLHMVPPLSGPSPSFASPCFLDDTASLPAHHCTCGPHRTPSRALGPGGAGSPASQPSGYTQQRPHRCTEERR